MARGTCHHDERRPAASRARRRALLAATAAAACAALACAGLLLLVLPDGIEDARDEAAQGAVNGAESNAAVLGLEETQRLPAIDLHARGAALCQERLFAASAEANATSVAIWDYDVESRIFAPVAAEASLGTLGGAGALACLPSSGDAVLVSTTSFAGAQTDGGAVSLLLAPRLNGSSTWSLNDTVQIYEASARPAASASFGTTLATCETDDGRAWAFVGAQDASEVYIYEVILEGAERDSEPGLWFHAWLNESGTQDHFGCALSAQGGWAAVGAECALGGSGLPGTAARWTLLRYNITQGVWAVHSALPDFAEGLAAAGGAGEEQVVLQDLGASTVAVDASASALVLGFPEAGSGAGAVVVWDPDAEGTISVLQAPSVASSSASPLGFGAALAVDDLSLVVASTELPGALWALQRQTTLAAEPWALAATIEDLESAEVLEVLFVLTGGSAALQGMVIVGAQLEDPATGGTEDAFVIYRATAESSAATAAPTVDYTEDLDPGSEDSRSRFGYRTRAIIGGALGAGALSVCLGCGLWWWCWLAPRRAAGSRDGDLGPEEEVEPYVESGFSDLDKATVPGGTLSSWSMSTRTTASRKSSYLFSARRESEFSRRGKDSWVWRRALDTFDGSDLDEEDLEDAGHADVDSENPRYSFVSSLKSESGRRLE